MKSLQQMTFEELVREGGEMRQQVESQIRRLGDVYRTLYERVRRSPADDDTVGYIMLSNVGQRFASMVLQGVRRVEPLERKILGATEQRRREVEEEEQRILKELRASRRETKRAEQAVSESTQLSDNDFLSLYGEDFE